MSFILFLSEAMVPLILFYIVGIDDRGGSTARFGLFGFSGGTFEESCKLALSSGTGGTCDFGAIGIKLRSDRTCA